MVVRKKPWWLGFGRLPAVCLEMSGFSGLIFISLGRGKVIPKGHTSLFFSVEIPPKNVTYD